MYVGTVSSFSFAEKSEKSGEGVMFLKLVIAKCSNEQEKECSSASFECRVVEIL